MQRRSSSAGPLCGTGEQRASGLAAKLDAACAACMPRPNSECAGEGAHGGKAGRHARMAVAASSVLQLGGRALAGCRQREGVADEGCSVRTWSHGVCSRFGVLPLHHQSRVPWGAFMHALCPSLPLRGQLSFHRTPLQTQVGLGASHSRRAHRCP